MPTFYATNTIVSVYQELSETPTGASATSSPNVGWTVGTTAPTVYAEFDAGTKAAAATFSATARPDGSINTTIGDCLRTTNPYTGSFASGNWTITFSVIGVTQAGAADGRARFRLFRSANANGSGATEITAAAQTGSPVTNLSTTAQDSAATFNPGAFSLTNEYLFVQVGWEITGAGGMSTTDVVMRIGTTATRVVTSSFTAEVTGSGNVAGSEAFGTDVLDLSVAAAGAVAGEEAFGTSHAALTTDAVGDVATAEAFGSATVENSGPGAIEITGVGNVGSEEAFGTLSAGLVLLAVGAILSAEGFGSTALDQSVQAAGAVVTAESFGTPTADLSLPAVGDVSSAEAFGSAGLGSEITGVGNVGSAEAFGTPALVLSAALGSAASGEAFGSATLQQNQFLDAAPAASEEAFGSASVGQLLAPGGVSSAEAFGAAFLDQALACQGAAGAEAFGSGSLSLCVVGVGNVGSAEAFGTPALIQPQSLQLSEIVSGEAYGSALLEQSGAALSGVGNVAGAEAFGASVFSLHALLSGAGGAEAFGAPLVQFATDGTVITLSGGGSGEAFGALVVEKTGILVSLVTDGVYPLARFVVGPVSPHVKLDTRVYPEDMIMGLKVGAVACIPVVVWVDGLKEDPDAIQIAVTNPSGVTSTYVFGTDDEVEQLMRAGQPLVAEYRAKIPCTAAGKWLFTWTSTGPAGVQSGYYDVATS